MMTFKTFVVLAGAYAIAQAIQWDGPEQTPIGIAATMGMTPIPTDLPRLEVRRMLEKRYISVPSNLCGYIDSDTGRQLK
jgi:hypothetical protein